MELKKYINKVICECLNEDIFRGDNSIKKYEKLLIDAVVNFFKDEWDFDAKIIVKKKQSNKFIGDISLNHNSIYNNKFTLHYNPNQSYHSIINSLIHELTHIKQVSKGELRPSDDWKYILWKDDFKISVHDYNKKIKNNPREYMELPWEKEALKNASDDSLYKKLFNSEYWINLKGKDINLDFIIDNIV
jgi:hypothetical protein